ncbi:MAG TPA: hypothetical protein VG891_00310 [Rhizomicrobium sp.]|nr:hypothetical protein [Rhizomicrobium sp.]
MRDHDRAIGLACELLAVGNECECSPALACQNHWDVPNSGNRCGIENPGWFVGQNYDKRHIFNRRKLLQQKSVTAAMKYDLFRLQWT